MCISGGNFNNVLGHLFSGTKEFTDILNIILQPLSSRKWCTASEEPEIHLEFFIKLHLVTGDMATHWVASPVLSP